MAAAFPPITPCSHSQTEGGGQAASSSVQQCLTRWDVSSLLTKNPDYRYRKGLSQVTAAACCHVERAHTWTHTVTHVPADHASVKKRQSLTSNSHRLNVLFCTMLSSPPLLVLAAFCGKFQIQSYCPNIVFFSGRKRKTKRKTFLFAVWCNQELSAVITHRSSPVLLMHYLKYICNIWAMHTVRRAWAHVAVTCNNMSFFRPSTTLMCPFHLQMHNST